MMGLFGLIGIKIFRLFIPSMMGNGMQLAISVAGLIIFAGLTAYDTQHKALQFQYTTADQSSGIYGPWFSILISSTCLNILFIGRQTVTSFAAQLVCGAGRFSRDPA